MASEAGIQSVGDISNFKDLDSRFRGNDGVFPITTQSLKREGVYDFFQHVYPRIRSPIQTCRWAGKGIR